MEKDTDVRIAEENYENVRDSVRGDPMMLMLRWKPGTIPNLYDTRLQKPVVKYQSGPYNYSEMDGPREAVVMQCESRISRDTAIHLPKREHAFVQYECMEILRLVDKAGGEITLGPKRVLLFKNVLVSSQYDADAGIYPLENSTAVNVLMIDPPIKSGDGIMFEDLKKLVFKTYTGFLACVQQGINTVNIDWGIMHPFLNDRSLVYYITFISAWLAGVKILRFCGHSAVGTRISSMLASIDKAVSIYDFLAGAANLLQGSTRDTPSTIAAMYVYN